MKNKNLRLLSASAAAIVVSSFSSAAQQLDNTWYEITYSAHFEEGIYTASRPMQFVGGGTTYSGDPATIAWHPVGPAGLPTLGSYTYHPDTAPWAPITWTPVTGRGLLNIATGEIRLEPVNWEVIVVSGSYGFTNWSQTLKGSFNPAHTVFTMTSATSDGGIRQCESAGTQSCTTDGGLGSLTLPLGVPQTYVPAETDEDGNVIVAAQPLQLHPNIPFSQAIGPGATARYFFQSDRPPAYTDTTIDITVGQVIYLPVPAAAWLFAPSLLGLFAGKRLRRR